jgi:hypothetical protein
MAQERSRLLAHWAEEEGQGNRLAQMQFICGRHVAQSAAR